MKKNVSRYGLFAALLLVSLACSLPLAGQATSTATALLPTQGTAPISPTPTATVALPLSIYDLYDANVESGQWSQGQGLVTLLRYATGQADLADALGGRELMVEEATGLLEMADEYLAANPEASEKAEIEKLANVLLPNPEKILPYAQPEGQARQGGGKLSNLAQSAQGQDVACTQLWSSGFAMSITGTVPVCVLYRTFTAGGVTFRVFYPRGWETQGHHAQMLDWVVEGLTRAAEEYRPLAARGLMPTDLVFTLRPFEEGGVQDPATDMAARSRFGGCNIGVFPVADTESEGAVRQRAAHELFHCFQKYNLPGPDTPLYIPKKWWTEGSAEYFSNVVYPDVNDEYRYMDELESAVWSASIFDFSYENFLFFQYLGNRLGPDGVLRLLSSMPSDGSRASYIQALNSGLPSANELFHNFGQAYLDKNIRDTSGGLVPVNPRLVGSINMYAQDGNDMAELAAFPYLLRMQRFVFPRYYRYALTMSQTGNGMSSARPAGAAGAWGALPSSVTTACRDREYWVLATRVDPAQSMEFRVRRTYERKEKCDPCLIGTWRLVPGTLEVYAFSLNYDRLQYTSVEGDLTIIFDIEDIATFIYQDVMASAVDPRLNQPATNITVGMTGAISGEYEADTGHIVFGAMAGPLTTHIWLNGEDLGEDVSNASEFNIGVPAEANYVCTRNNLTFTPVIPDKSVVGFELTRQGEPEIWEGAP